MSYSTLRKGFTDFAIDKVADKAIKSTSNAAKKEVKRLEDQTKKAGNSLKKSKKRIKQKKQDVAKAQAAENAAKPILKTVSNVATNIAANKPIKVTSDQIILHVKEKVHQSLGGDEHIEVVGEPLIVKVEREVNKNGTVRAYVVGSKRYVLQTEGTFSGQYVLEKQKKNKEQE